MANRVGSVWARTYDALVQLLAQREQALAVALRQLGHGDARPARDHLRRARILRSSFLKNCQGSLGFSILPSELDLELPSF